MGALEGRVAIITGAARGIGREHALFFASEGAAVVVNDLGGALHGSLAQTGESEGDDCTAEDVVGEIRARGGRAIANTEDVADFAAAERVVAAAVEAFGDLHVVVNNAGILRDRLLVNLEEEEWDEVIRVHLRGHFAMSRWAAAYWRKQSKAGGTVEAAIVNTTSTSGLLGNPGQSNYGAAKAAIAALTIISAQELARYGVRVNAVAPAARTRMTEQTPGLAEIVQPPVEDGRFDPWDPGHVAPLVAYLASTSCSITGRVFFIQGGTVQLFEPWTLTEAIDRQGRWSVAELAEELPKLVSGASAAGAPSRR